MDVRTDVSDHAGSQVGLPSGRRVLRRIGEHGGLVDGVEYKNANVLLFDEKQYVFSHRAILTVVVSAACNAGCLFCSNEITFTPSGPYLKFDEKLVRVRDFALTAGVTKIAYTGGEPTLNPQGLLDLVSHMSPGFARSRLHTNGWGLAKSVSVDGERVELLDALIARGLTGVSVSVAHHDAHTNRRVMRLPTSWAGMSETALASVASRADGTFTPRLSCVLTGDGVDDVSGILEYVSWGRSLGFRRFIFRTCSEIPDGFKKSTSFSSYNDENGQRLDPLSREFERRTGAQLEFRQRKGDSKVDVYRWGGVTVDLDESGEELDPDSKIRRLNVMPNGVVYTSWIAADSNLFDDDQGRMELALAAGR